MLLKALTNTVAVSTPLNGIPAPEIIDGLTIIMYMVAKKVVMPAIISVLVSVFVTKSTLEDYEEKYSFITLSVLIKNDQTIVQNSKGIIIMR